MEKIITTRHLTQERMDRVVYIGTTIGFGEVVEEVLIPERQHYECMTNTGVIIVKGLDKRTIITMYIARVHQLNKLYALAKKPVPMQLKRIVQRNEKRKLMEESEKFKA